MLANSIVKDSSSPDELSDYDSRGKRYFFGDQCKVGGGGLQQRRCVKGWAYLIIFVLYVIHDSDGQLT